MIQVANLIFRYPNQEIDTIKGISFKIEKGEIYGFLGPSGAGKSTTQKILIKLLSEYKGQIQVMGHDLKSYNNSYYNKIGVGFELPNHYAKLTGLENLKLFASFYEVKNVDLMELLHKVGLTDAAHQKTQDYSKGMKMRLNFVRALLHDPEILFFDEPTSGLDPVNAKNIKDIILDLKAKGKTIFLTTHNMHDADELCDRVAFITNGQIMAEGSPKALKLKFGKPLLNVEYQNSGFHLAEFELENLGQNLEFRNILESNKIISMHTREASLDEVFIKTTGEQLTLTD
ncbi:MAG: ABC transporter ATP-binding protein [Salinivirgaceae bacterium]|jgi:fluoroquinolone transport system ATP-binding protein|nr:ABC transporter ATP-binding protein [Salinivirgaceae bacterium]